MARVFLNSSVNSGLVSFLAILYSLNIYKTSETLDALPLFPIRPLLFSQTVAASFLCMEPCGRGQPRRRVFQNALLCAGTPTGGGADARH